MTKNTDNNTPGANKPQIVESGYWVFLLVWVKTFAVTAIIVLIFKYLFKLI